MYVCKRLSVHVCLFLNVATINIFMAVEKEFPAIAHELCLK